MRSKELSAVARGCLLAGAVGDALGAPIEFMRWDEIKAAHGVAGLRTIEPAYGRLGAITDDTQMSLFTTEAMIHARFRAATKGIVSLPDMAWRSYLRWMHTQGELGAQQDLEPRSMLMKEAALFSRRGPGLTCLTALRAPKQLDGKARNDSKGCGGVMRAAPCGLFWLSVADAGTRPFEQGIECAQLTHGHPTGALTAGALAQMVYAVGRGARLRDAAIQAIDLLAREQGHLETTRAIQATLHLADAHGIPGPLAIRELGEGWVAEEALSIGLYAALKAPDLREGLLLAVNHDGDSDSTGSIAGNLLGALYGEAAIPSEWLEPLECRELIAQAADDLVDCLTPQMNPDYVAPESVARTAFWRRWGYDV
jgi:ADP-ribosylglycohydrolase